MCRTPSAKYALPIDCWLLGKINSHVNGRRERAGCNRRESSNHFRSLSQPFQINISQAPISVHSIRADSTEQSSPHTTTFIKTPITTLTPLHQHASPRRVLHHRLLQQNPTIASSSRNGTQRAFARRTRTCGPCAHFLLDHLRQERDCWKGARRVHCAWPGQVVWRRQETPVSDLPFPVHCYPSSGLALTLFLPPSAVRSCGTTSKESVSRIESPAALQSHRGEQLGIGLFWRLAALIGGPFTDICFFHQRSPPSYPVSQSIYILHLLSLSRRTSGG